MVHYGSPELPESNEESVDTSEIHVTNYGQDASDDSDDEGVGTAYDGYEPLPTTDTPIPNHNVNRETNTNDNNSDNSDLPAILSSDAEISRQVWNEPRPPVLDLELDSSRAQQIMTAMANISLPNSAIPEWAESVPEERWKQDLLDRIRRRRDTPQNGEGFSK